MAECQNRNQSFSVAGSFEDDGAFSKEGETERMLVNKLHERIRSFLTRATLVKESDFQSFWRSLSHSFPSHLLWGLIVEPCGRLTICLEEERYFSRKCADSFIAFAQPHVGDCRSEIESPLAAKP
ncbi:MAG: hypothetical protein RIC55_18935 [Pirellulaceae bacterium]